VPVGEVRAVHDRRPEQCEHCGSKEPEPDGTEPVRHQVTDLPTLLKPETDE
jgi:hypothetical protein